MSITAGQEFYRAQIGYLYAKDVEGLVEHHYHSDAVLVTFDVTARGHEALKAHFRGHLELLGDFRVQSTDRFAETEDTIFFEATVKSSHLGIVRVYDAFVLKNGKISYHFAGVK